MPKKNGAKKWDSDRFFQQAEKRLKRALANLDGAYKALDEAVQSAHPTTRFRGEVILYNENDEWDPESEKFIAGFDFRFGGHATVMLWRNWQG